MAQQEHRLKQDSGQTAPFGPEHRPEPCFEHRSKELLVTTVHKSTPVLEERARALAAELGADFVPREGKSAERLTREAGDNGLLIVEKNNLTLYQGEETFFFHPNMAVLRIQALKKGQRDPLVHALDIRSGDRILDCTLGLGADALVAAFAAGDEGAVTGIEHNRLIALIVREGLQHFRHRRSDDLHRAMARIRVLQGDHRALLKGFSNGSFDSVYFDPMFRQALRASNGIGGLRQLADPRPIEADVIAEARRVARRRVVMKERRDSPEWERLAPEHVECGKYAPVAYGIWSGGGEVLGGERYT
ncbi:class I SAM-dependent methyltransferase [Heliobacterium undosum]|uniref:Class I SAM-dependent methyltransferase n=1 Tax=Heliomicrobium undosum TaxID=121734 RepID=A0A845KZH6_9FIRM|nr:class I SAM-dependent methyltransferase [Heliomicrobium undosum]MZP28586.1 class I SAM-dependent methyltransferase [Heliomicrobium undosum]